MELTIVLSVPESSEDYDVLDTLESIPWDESGVDLIIYSKDTEKIKKIISEGDLESTIRGSDVGILFCETPEKDSNHHTIGLGDTKTDAIMFLKAGDIIEDFQGDLLTTAVQGPIGLPGLGKEGLPETVLCYECRTLPDSYRGVIFKTQWLYEKGITDINLGVMAKICNHLRSKLDTSNYWGGWSDYDISESLSVSRTETNEEDVIESLKNVQDLDEFSYSPYIRDLVWTRIMTSAAKIVSNSNTSGVYKYLYPTKKIEVLS